MYQFINQLYLIF